MSRINAYLNFEGNCEEALDFYQEVFGGELVSKMTYAEAPAGEGMPPMPEELLSKIMHATLQIDENTNLMASDVGGEWANDVVTGNNVWLSYSPDSVADGQRIFDAIAAADGTVQMPFEPQFWGDVFGMVIDRFGFGWMVIAQPEQS